MATLRMTKENFDETLKNSEILFIDFWAEWCGPCKMFAPVFEKASEKHPNAVFAKVDTEAQRELAGSFGIRSIPTLAVFRDQILVFMQPGALPESVFEQLIDQVEGLDMNEVRAEIAKQEAAKAEGQPQA